MGFMGLHIIEPGSVTMASDATNPYRARLPQKKSSEGIQSRYLIYDMCYSRSEIRILDYFTMNPTGQRHQGGPEPPEGSLTLPLAHGDIPAPLHRPNCHQNGPNLLMH